MKGIGIKLSILHVHYTPQFQMWTPFHFYQSLNQGCFYTTPIDPARLISPLNPLIEKLTVMSKQRLR